MSINILTTPNSPFQWIDIEAPTESELLEMSEKYGIHRYSIRDCMESDHLPKIEHIENFNFIISRVYLIEKKYHDDTQTIQELTTKLAFFYNEKVLITVHRLPLDFIEEIKDKFLNLDKINPSKIVVRGLWHVMQSFEKPSIELMKEIDIYEEKIFLKDLSPSMMKKLYFIKRKTHSASKLLILSHGIISSIESDDKVALNDLRDLHLKLTSIYNQNYEDINSLLNFYLSISSQKTNEVMRILTIFSAFFLPLTFIAGVYGMNFKYLPELDIKWAYPVFWIVCVLITILIFQWFWRKKWL